MVNKSKIIAEVGVNHNGSLKILKKLIHELSKIDIDFIKLQLYKTEELVTPLSKSAGYAKKVQSNQYKMLKKYELKKTHLEYLEKIKKNKIKLLFTPFDENSLNYLISKKNKIIKISSSDLTSIPFLNEISKNKIKVILSTGMSKNIEIDNAIKILISKKKIKTNDISLLYCVSSYPTELTEIDLENITKLKKKYKNCKIGLSDHTISNVTGAISVLKGAQIIEKHVTLNKNFLGPDHKSSLSINEFKNYVTNIRDTEKLLINKTNRNQNKNIKYVRKYLVAKKNIKKNEIFTRDNLAYMRCSDGIYEIKYFEKFLNKKSLKNYKKYEPISKI